MDNRIKVFITSCETTPDAWRGQEEKLIELYECSNKKYALVEDSEEADVILIGDLRGGNWGEKIMNNLLIRRYPEKCFSLSHEDRPIMLHHGLYTSNEFSIMRWNRVRTGAYNLLPEKYKNPYIKGKISGNKHFNPQKEYLFSFIGRNSHPCRELIYRQKFSRKDILIEDSSAFDLWKNPINKEQRQEYYVNMLLASKFSLCPRGWATNSIRLFESMELGVAPVVISDAFVFPKGPDWNSFSIQVKEKHINDLENIVSSYENSFADMGIKARAEFLKWFSDSDYFNYVVDNCLDIKNHQFIPESFYWKINTIYIFLLKLKIKERANYYTNRIIQIIKRKLF